MPLPPGTLTRARHAWEGLCEGMRSTGRIPIEDIFTNPVLLRPEVLAAIVKAVPAVGNDVGTAVEEAVRDLTAQLSGPGAGVRYPLGPGPLETLMGKLEGGVLSEEAAIAAAAALPVTEGLTPAYVEALLRNSQDGADPTRWRAIRTRSRLVLTAVDACDRKTEPAMVEAVDYGVIASSHFLLCAVPDRRMLMDADARGQRLLAATEPGSTVAADLHFDLAALWGDPYTTDRVSASRAVQDEAWERRGYRELTKQDGVSAADWMMPDVKEALATSINHWRGSYRIDHRPRTVAGWVDAEIPLAETTRSDVSFDLGPAVIEALAKLNREDSDAFVLSSRLLAAANYLDLELPDIGKSGLDAADLDALVSQHGPLAARTAIQYAQVLEARNPLAAIAILDHFSTLFVDSNKVKDEDFQLAAFSLIRSLYAAWGEPLPPRTETSGTLLDRFQELLTGLDPESLPSHVATLALRLALASINEDAEKDGINLLSLANSVAPLLTARYRWALDTLAATLYANEGSNRHQADDDPAAVLAYVRALELWQKLGRRSQSAELLDRLVDISASADEDAVVEVIGRLTALAPQLLAGLGPMADDAIAGIMTGAMGALIRLETMNLEVLWAAMQFRSGLRTAMVLSIRGGPDLAADEVSAPLLQQLAGFPITTRNATAVSLRTAIQARHRDLKIAEATAPPLLDVEQLRRAIDGRTVVLATSTVNGQDHNRGRLALLLWDDGQSPLFTGWRAADDFLPIVPEGLTAELKMLAEAGKDHLCVFTDSGLQTAPWHQLSLDDGVVLGDHWTVTLLPHPHALMRGRTGGMITREPDLPVASFGIADAGPGWEPLADAVEEAASVAAALGGVAIPEAEASKEKLRHLAQRSQYVHIASHGVFHAEHPAFHAVLLHPGDGDDGVLNAWEVAQLDLSAVQLVTLSACETASLVVEAGDSVDGLPVAFLSAGARAIIGSQIEVETRQSRFFYENLYQALASGPDLRDAFRTARDATRAQFPDSEAWASFYLLGDWR